MSKSPAIHSWAVLPLCMICFTLPTDADDNWPRFRGSRASGVAEGEPPIHWDTQSGESVLWSVKIPGMGHSSPIVFGNRVYLTTAVKDAGESEPTPTGFLKGTGDSVDEDSPWSWQVHCYELGSGEEIWKRTATSGVPKLKRHLKSTHCDCTPATDGQRVVAFFASEGLYCYDKDGELLWKKDFGKLHAGPYDAPKMEWGFSSSPTIYQGKVIVQCDCLNTNFVSLLDIKTGKEIRRIDRDDVASWSSPTVIETPSGTQLVCNGYHQMASYDLQSGEQLWTLGGGGDIPVPCPLLARGRVIITNAHARNRIYAVQPDARGDLTPEDDSDSIPDGLAWYHQRGGSYIPTPIAIGDTLYVCSDRGILRVFDIETGDAVYTKRVGGMYSASAVGTDSHIYLPSENGQMHVVKTGSEYELLATNDMGASLFATPAITGDRLIVRTATHLVCLGH